MTRVVATVGTDHHPYERMIEWMAAAQEQLGLDVFVQRGATPWRTGIETVDYLGADELGALMESADAVVCHGGPGTISLARQSGHRPIVMARNPSLGEHVDDHQMRYVAKLASDDVIDTASTLEELLELLRHPRPTVDRDRADDEAALAVAEFGSLVGRLLDGTLPKHPLRRRFYFRRER
jgi:UDP-N-acetylglucosamine transferase subunit ALG13